MLLACAATVRCLGRFVLLLLGGHRVRCAGSPECESEKCAVRPPQLDMQPGRHVVAPKPRGRARRLARKRPRARPRAHLIKSVPALDTFSIEELVERDRRGHTVLHALAREGRPRLFLAVLQRLPPRLRGPFLNAQTTAMGPGCGRRTALHMAALYGRVGMCRLLVEAGANPRLRDEKNRTASEILRCIVEAAERDFSEAVSQRRMATAA